MVLSPKNVRNISKLPSSNKSDERVNLFVIAEAINMPLQVIRKCFDVRNLHYV